MDEMRNRLTDDQNNQDRMMLEVPNHTSTVQNTTTTNANQHKDLGTNEEPSGS